MTFRSTLLAAVAGLGITGGAVAQGFPERDLQGIIMWGAGGAMDTVSRAITPAAEEALGRSIVLINRPGGTGAIATTTVNAGAADGYTLLYGAENPQLHGVMGLSEIDYGDFFPVNILGRGVAVIVTRPDAEWNSVGALFEAANADPGSVRMGSTGPGGIPFVVDAMLQSVAEHDVTPVPFDGEGPALTALQGGHVDFVPAGISAAAELIKAGTVKALAVVDLESSAMLPDVPPITEEFPDMAALLPWGPFYGVFAKSDIPDDAKAKLVEAFATAAESASFTDIMSARGNIVMNISGEEAAAFLDGWQARTTWLLQDAGETTVSPEDLGIARP